MSSTTITLVLLLLFFLLKDILLNLFKRFYKTIIFLGIAGFFFFLIPSISAIVFILGVIIFLILGKKNAK